MRMRRKKNLDERISSCDRHLLFVETADFYQKENSERFNLIDFRKVFGNDNPIWLDLGCGKGGFSLETAKRNKEVNVIGVEKISNVIIEACEKAAETDPDNCMFLNCAVENLPYYIQKGKIERIFLNFSCPYPKHTYKNRRFTYKNFLKVYKYLLSENGEIHLKTDNMRFFEFSLQSLSENGFKLKNISLDLQNSDFKDNIETEYEKLFISKGLPIYRLEAYL
ncbi:MAG: tRNA (guanosine(46)-N7)-methyltransferase TrmB [Clostridia bacterium]|nr:tRNA (guanosine(46)-N7)-methyltransferase TrmB [Clostridia bacterium]